MNAPLALKNVAHSAHPYLPMSQSWIYNQLIFLRRYHPFVLTKRTENLEFFPLDDVHALYARPWYDVGWQKLGRAARGYFPFFREVMREKQACLLHSHSGSMGRWDWKLARDVHVPHVVSFYGADIWLDSMQPAARREYDQLFHSADVFLVEGRAMREKVISLGCDPEKLRVHHLGIRPDKIPFEPRTAGADGTIRFLMAGRAIEKKGHLYGLLAFAKLARKYPNVRLLIMTWGTYDDTETNLRKLTDAIGENGLGDRVEIVGQQPYDEYLRITRDCHVFVNPSVHAANGDAEGGFPVTITEMLASGMPVIGTTHCDIPEIVRDGETGLLAPEKDVDALAEKMEMLVTQPALWQGFAARGRALVEKEYNVTAQAERLEAVYDSLVASG